MGSPSATRRLAALAQQLRLYKPPSLLVDIGNSNSISKGIEDHSEKFVPFTESSTRIPQSHLGKDEVGDDRDKVERPRAKRAAVLVCLFEGETGELRVILTKRSSKIFTYSGEVALPGGKMEEGDRDDVCTALREAKEEIGLDPALVNVVTVLEPFLAKHLVRVVPVIGILSKKEVFKPILNTEEVAAVFDAPLEMFIKDENRTVEEILWMGNKCLVHFFNYETSGSKFLIWGLTAGILIRAASVVYQRPPPFLEQNPGLKFPKLVDG